MSREELIRRIKLVVLTLATYLGVLVVHGGELMKECLSDDEE